MGGLYDLGGSDGLVIVGIRRSKCACAVMMSRQTGKHAINIGTAPATQFLRCYGDGQRDGKAITDKMM